LPKVWYIELTLRYVAFVFANDPGYSFFHTTMMSILLVACASTLMQEGLLRIVATFPPQYTQAVVSGQSFAGLAVSLSNFIILWAGEDDTRYFHSLHANADLCAFLYFVLVFITLVLCLLSFAILTRMTLFRHYQSVDHPGHHQKEYFDDASSEAETIDTLDSSPRKHLLGDEDGGREGAGGKVDILEIAFKIRFYAAATFFIFIVTLGVFPGITSAIKSTQPEKGIFFDKLFTPFTLILFNASDFVARLSASWWPVLGQKKVLLASLARLVFFPLLMLCNLQNKSHEVITTVLFRSDVLAMLFLAGCAFSNGLLCTLAFMEYPDLLQKNAEKELGGSVVFFVLSIGLTAGSLMSFVLRAMLKP
jgi:equilibrative nucleoside transporter 1/2/3